MRDAPRLLVLSAQARNRDLLVQFLEKEGYSALGAASLEEMDRILDRGEALSLALLELSGFDRTIWSRCERLRDSGVPFLVISPRQGEAVRREAMAQGAGSVLVKPLQMRELSQLLRSMLS